MAESADPIRAPRDQMKIPVYDKVSKGLQDTVNTLAQGLSHDGRVTSLGAGMEYVRCDAADFILVAATAPGAVYLMYLKKSISKPAHHGLLETSSP